MNTKVAKDALKAALEVVVSGDVPDELKCVAFGRVFDLIVAGQGGRGQALSTPSTGLRQDAGQSEVGVDASELAYRKIAESLGVDQDKVERLFLAHDGQLRFEGRLDRLGNTKAEMVSKVVLMLVVARQAADYDAGATLDAEVRQEIDRLGLLDTSNYTKQVARLTPLLSFFGSGKAASYKVKYDGKVEAKSIAQALLEPDGAA